MKNIQFYNELANRGCQWNDCTLLMPAVSVGNVGQLAVDLLITTLIYERKIKLVGRIFSSSLKSVSGPNAYEFGDDCPIMTTCEVYECVEHKLVIIQLRAPPYKERRRQFVEELTQWIKEEKFNLSILLGSSFSQYLSPKILSTESNTPMRYIATSSFKSDSPDSFFEQLGIVELKEIEEDEDEPSLVSLVGGGLTKALYQNWQKEGIKGMCFIIFCSEGDNTPEALQMVESANKVIKLKEPLSSSSSNSQKRQNRWRTPISWMNIFGGAIPANLF